MTITDWNEWHREYDQPGSELADRLRLVQEQVRVCLDASPVETLGVLSICAGQGREVFGALVGHPNAANARVWLIELDPANADVARRTAADADLPGVTVLEGDASTSDVYREVSRSDLVVMSGVLGHLDDTDQRRTVAFLPQVCRTGATVVWTTFEQLAERVAATRSIFAAREFDEVSSAVTFDGTYGVVAHRYRGRPQPFQPGARIFTFASAWPDPAQVPDRPPGLYPSRSGGADGSDREDAPAG